MRHLITVTITMEGDVTRNEWPTLEEEIAAAVLAEGVTDPGHKFLAVEVDDVAPVWYAAGRSCPDCGREKETTHRDGDRWVCEDCCDECRQGHG